MTCIIKPYPTTKPTILKVNTYHMFSKVKETEETVGKISNMLERSIFTLLEGIFKVYRRHVCNNMNFMISCCDD